MTKIVNIKYNWMFQAQYSITSSTAWRGKWGLTVLSFFSSGISVIWILEWGIAVSFSPAVCGISSFWLTVFGKRRSRYCGTVHCALLFNASLHSRRLDDPSRVSLVRARSLSRPLLPKAPATQPSLMHVSIFKTLD